MEFKYLLFRCLTSKISKTNLTDDNLIRKCVWREFDVAFFMVRGISLGKRFSVVSTWRAPVRKRLKPSTLNFEHTFLTDCCTKPCPFFLIMSHSFFIAIILRVLRAHFAWKQLKVDYSKNVWKEQNRGQSFVCLLVGYISVKKDYWKLQFYWCRSS